MEDHGAGVGMEGHRRALSRGVTKSRLYLPGRHGSYTETARQEWGGHWNSAHHRRGREPRLRSVLLSPCPYLFFQILGTVTDFSQELV